MLLFICKPIRKNQTINYVRGIFKTNIKPGMHFKMNSNKSFSKSSITHILSFITYKKHEFPCKNPDSLSPCYRPNCKPWIYLWYGQILNQQKWIQIKAYCELKLLWRLLWGPWMSQDTLSSSFSFCIADPHFFLIFLKILWIYLLTLISVESTHFSVI